MGISNNVLRAIVSKIFVFLGIDKVFHNLSVDLVVKNRHWI